jgi:ABC-type transport system substrate-binding protein
MKITSVLLTASVLLTIPQLSYGTEKQSDAYRMAIPSKMESFDPIYANTSTSENVIRNMYSTLVNYRTRIDALGQHYSDIVPFLADDWNISSDRKIYNFKIKNNVYFHNGRKLSAYDVKHTIERLANPKILPASMSWIFKDIPIKGLSKYQQQIRNNVAGADLSGIVVMDDNLVQITLDSPTPLFLKELALPVFSIIPKEETDKWGSEFGIHPVGTGPYSLQSVSTKQIILKKNPHYFEPGLPNISSLTYKVTPLINDEYKLFQKGDLDQTDIPDTQIDKLIQKAEWDKMGVNVFDSSHFNDREISDIIKEPKLVSTFLGINSRKNILNSAKFRQALNYSINKSKLISRILKFRAIESVGLLPEYFPGAPEDRKAPYPFDQIKAKKLFYEVGLVDKNQDGILEYKGSPVSLNLWYYEDKEAEKVCKAIKDDLKSVGFNINLKKSTTWSDFVEKVASGEADLYHFSWKAHYADPDKFLSPLFDSKYIGSTNLAGFSNPGVDSLLSKARKIPDDEFRNKVYQDVEKMIVETAPWVFLYQPVKYVMVKPYVYGVQVHPVLDEVIKYSYFSNPEESLSLSNKTGK